MAFKVDVGVTTVAGMYGVALALAGVRLCELQLMTSKHKHKMIGNFIFIGNS